MRRLVDTTDIFLVPSLNPDGYEEEDRCMGLSVIYLTAYHVLHQVQRQHGGPQPSISWLAGHSAVAVCSVSVGVGVKYENMKYWETFKISLKLPI